MSIINFSLLSNISNIHKIPVVRICPISTAQVFVLVHKERSITCIEIIIMWTLSAVLRSRWPSPQLTTKSAGFSFEVSPVPTTMPWSGSTIAGDRERERERVVRVSESKSDRDY